MAGLVRPGDLLLLVGEMGAGKTAFTQGFAAGLGVEDPVTSPTFTLVHHYDGGRLPVHHVDVYRLDRLAELLDLALPELLDGRGVTLVEWGDAIVAELPADFLEVRLAYGDDPEERTVELRVVGSSWSARLADLHAAVAPWRAA